MASLILSKLDPVSWNLVSEVCKQHQRIRGKISTKPLPRPTRGRKTDFNVQDDHGITFRHRLWNRRQKYGLDRMISIYGHLPSLGANFCCLLQQAKDQADNSSSTVLPLPISYLANHLAFLPRCLPTTACKFHLVRDLHPRNRFQHLPDRVISWLLDDNCS